MEDYAAFLKRIFLKITTDEVTFIKQVSVHPRDRLKNKKVKSIHSPDKMERKTQQIAAENAVTLLKVMFNFSTKKCIKQDHSIRYISHRRRESLGKNFRSFAS